MTFEELQEELDAVQQAHKDFLDAIKNPTDEELESAHIATMDSLTEIFRRYNATKIST